MIKVTKHAKKRILERFKKLYFQGDVLKALESKEQIPIWFAKKDLTKMGFTTYAYRALSGNVYVFRKEEGNFILLTVYKSNGNKGIFSKKNLPKRNKKVIRTFRTRQRDDRLFR